MENEVIEIEQPVVGSDATAAGIAAGKTPEGEGYPKNDVQPQATSHWSTKLKTGNLNRPTISRSEGRTGTPSKRTAAAAPVARQTTPAVAPITRPTQQVATQPQAPVAPPVTAPVAEPEPAKAQVADAAKPSGPRLLRAESQEDLIEIPGEKPRTVSQWKAEIAKARINDQREGQLNYRTQQLDERERQLQTTRPTVQAQAPHGAPQAAPQTAPQAQQPIDDKPEPRPSGAIEGDDEWNAWNQREIARLVRIGMRQEMAPIVDSIRQSSEERDAQTKAQQEAAQRYERNDSVFVEGLRAGLPFDPAGLSQEAYNQVWDAVRVQAIDIDPNYDFADKQKMATVDLNPAIIKAAAKLAFPANALPPGYTAAEEPSPQLIAALEDKPIVAAAPKKPLPATIADAMPSRDARGGNPNGQKASWHDKLRNPGGLSPVTIRRSQGSS
jgi:hypothetical protein